MEKAALLPVRFEFSRYGDDAVSGFDMGDLRFVLGVQEVSSQAEPRLRMMIYLSLIGLIDGMVRLGWADRSEVVAVDSSFALRFERKQDEVTLFYGRRLLGRCGFLVLLCALQSGAEDFLEANRLDADDPVSDDLSRSLADLQEALRRQWQGRGGEDGGAYWFGVCPRCAGQGRLVIRSDADDGELFLHCDECESAWAGPWEVGEAGKGFWGYQRKSHYADKREILQRGWGAYMNRPYRK